MLLSLIETAETFGCSAQYVRIKPNEAPDRKSKRKASKSKLNCLSFFFRVRWDWTLDWKKLASMF